ncbi:MAG: methyltransferase domain-containing protein [Rickettsiales bacterium]|nr:methyltransferase domain-containing protein [Rickettsiales bacterium]
MDTKKQNIRQSFNKGSAVYNQYNIVQQQAAEYLVSLSDINLLKFRDVLLDLGCGNGSISEKILSIYEPKNYIGIDIADQSLEQISGNIVKICADIDNLPIISGSSNIIFSNMALQWLNNYDKVLSDMYDLLGKDGVLIFSIPVDGSFYSINNIYAGLFNKLPDEDLIKYFLKEKNFNILKSETKIYTTQFNSCFDALQSIKSLGAGVNLRNNNGVVLSRRALRIVDEYFQGKKIPLDYKIFYVIAQK